MRAVDVFTPGAFPLYTRVDREQVLHRLTGAISTSGMVVSVAGPSKCGKTVLIETTGIPLIVVAGSFLESAGDLWALILDRLNRPIGSTAATSKNAGASVSLAARAEGSVPLVAKGSVTATGQLQGGLASSKAQSYGRRGMEEVLEELAESDFLVVIDDYHFAPDGVRDQLSKQLKEAVRRGLRVCVSTAAHRPDELEKYTSNLTGRVTHVPMKYWEVEELREIAVLGFRALNMILDNETINAFAQEAIGSPQLMQLICLCACRHADIRQAFSEPTPVEFDYSDQEQVFAEVCHSIGFHQLVSDLSGGIGEYIRRYRFNDGTDSTAIGAVLRVLGADPLELEFSCDEIHHRIAVHCSQRGPSKQEVRRSCATLSTYFSAERFSSSASLLSWDADTEALVLEDPYFLFFLRWSPACAALASERD